MPNRLITASEVAKHYADGLNKLIDIIIADQEEQGIDTTNTRKDIWKFYAMSVIHGRG